MGTTCSGVGLDTHFGKKGFPVWPSCQTRHQRTEYHTGLGFRQWCDDFPWSFLLRCFQSHEGLGVRRQTLLVMILLFPLCVCCARAWRQRLMPLTCSCGVRSQSCSGSSWIRGAVRMRYMCTSASQQMGVAQNQTGGVFRRSWSTFPLTRVPCWYRFFEPQPNGCLVCVWVNSLFSLWFSRETKPKQLL